MHKKAGYNRPHSDKKVLLSCSTHAAACALLRRSADSRRNCCHSYITGCRL